MLSNKDLYEEIEKVDKIIEDPNADTATILKGILKVGSLNAKLMHNIRTNTVAVMKKFGIELVKPATAGDRPASGKTDQKKD